jgi:hypothetical protein
MGQVYIFPITVEQRKRLEQHHGPWKFADLRGQRPDSHPAVKRGPKGRVLPEYGQVWVEAHTQLLVRITDLYEARKGFYPYNVVFAPYGPSFDAKCLAETTFRQTHEIWDTWGDSQKKYLIEKLGRLSATDPQSPFRNFPDPAASAEAFFGLDREGNR